MRIVLGIILFAVLFSTATSASDLAIIRIDNSENVTFLNHTSDNQGNWIGLTGGTSIRIPQITFNYSGVSPVDYTKNGKTINITSLTNYEVTYPFTTHQMYSNNSNVAFTFYNSSELTGNIDIYLTKTSPAELRDIISTMVDGNTTPFRDLLNSSINTSYLDLDVSNQINYGPLSSGDYVILILRNESNNNLTIASATTFQVLEYDLIALPLDLTALAPPDSVQQGNNYEMWVYPYPLSAPESSYTYGAFLIHNDSYKSTLKLRSNGTKAGTNISADSQSLVDAFMIAGMGLDNVNRSTVQRIAEGVIGANNGSVSLKSAGNITSFSLVTDDLKLGKYILLVGVWSNTPGEKLIGFYQKEVNLTSTAADNNAPVITITFPADGSTLNVLNNSVMGNITDDSDIATANLTLNDVFVTNLSKGSFNVQVNYTPDATNTIKISATDAYGNSNSTQILVNVLPNSITITTDITANQTIAVNSSDTRNATNTVIELNATISANVTMSINASTNASALNATPATSTSIYGFTQNQRSLEKYIEVNVAGLNNTDLNFVNLTMYYTIADLDKNGDGDADDIGDLNEQALKMYWFDTNTSLWMPLGPDDKPDYTSLGGPKVLDSGRNTTAKYLRVTLNHFSIFGLVAELVTAPESSDGDGSGDSGGSGSGGSSSGGGGGGGGGGVITSEPYDNIAKAERYDKDLIANIPVTYIFTVPEHGIYEIAITGIENENGIAIRAEALKGTSKLVTVPAPGTVYKNTNIWVGTKRIKEAIVRFKVENSWLASNKLTASDIKLVRWDGKQWVQLETKEKTKDSAYTYYEAKTSVFSPFAISSIKGGTVPAETPVKTPVITATPEITSTSAVIVMPPGKSTQPESTFPTTYAIIAVVIIALVMYFVVIRKK